ncbi:MAG: pyridoxamine 5'-phosphate oxidase family protein [Actinomycetota bacterium]
MSRETDVSQSRPTIQELTEDECWQLLAAKTVGRLAVSIKNKPDIFPVNYRVDNRTVVIKTAPGLKLAASTLGGAVAFEADDIDEAARTAVSVVIRGTATEIERLDELLDAEDLTVEPWAGGSKNRYVRIEPDHVTGRRIPHR